VTGTNKTQVIYNTERGTDTLDMYYYLSYHCPGQWDITRCWEDGNQKM